MITEELKKRLKMIAILSWILAGTVVISIALTLLTGRYREPTTALALVSVAAIVWGLIVRWQILKLK